MVERKSYAYDDRNMNQYKMRTAYNGSSNQYMHNRSGKRHVQVADSSGCCCCKSSNQVSSGQATEQPTTPPLTAHQIAHSRLDTPDPFYSYNGRTNKHINETRNSHQGLNEKHKNHSSVPTTQTRQPHRNYNHPEQPVHMQQTNRNRNHPEQIIHTQQTNRNRNRPVQPTASKKNQQSSSCTIL